MARFGYVCATIVAVCVVGFLTSCGVEVYSSDVARTEAETARIAACVSVGGSWLRVAESGYPGAYECRR